MRRFEWRRRARTGFRILWVLNALFWLTGGIGATVQNAATESTGETIASIALALGMAATPLLCHLWWSRHHPIVDPRLAGVAPSADDVLRAKLQQVVQAADELKSRGWSTPQDHKAIRDRVDRLAKLVEADAISMQRGGRRSTVIEPEIDLLRDRVLGILDAAINSAAVAPGDSELDARLQAQLDSLHARQRAVNEIEGRPQTSH